MEYLKTNDEIINRIHTARQEDYWDLYLVQFENQIEEYTDAFEWDKAKGACSELNDIASKFPKKWWTLQARYNQTVRINRQEIKDLYNDEINIIEHE
jgi:hypothetical protein